MWLELWIRSCVSSCIGACSSGDYDVGRLLACATGADLGSICRGTGTADGRLGVCSLSAYALAVCILADVDSVIWSIVSDDVA